MYRIDRYLESMRGKEVRGNEEVGQHHHGTGDFCSIIVRVRGGIERGTGEVPEVRGCVHGG
jgi:hypothetical protein